jgi:hypothetical protein
MLWKIWKVARIVLLFGLVAVKNHWLWPSKSWMFKIIKSVIETTALVLMAMYAPIFLVVFGTAWAAGRISHKGKYLAIAAGVIASTVLTTISGVALEVLIILGIVAIEPLSRDTLNVWTMRRERRKANEMEGPGL